MSSSSLLRFLLVTAIFYPAVGNGRGEHSADASSSGFDMVGGGFTTREGRGLKSEKKETKKKRKKRSPACVAIYVVVPIHRQYILYIYIYYNTRSTVFSERKTFRNALLYIYIYKYHIPLHCYYIRYNVYVYIELQQDYSSNFFFRFPRFI